MRILCLHGYGTNGNILSTQLAPIRSQLPEAWEFIFLDGEEVTLPAPGMSQSSRASFIDD